MKVTYDKKVNALNIAFKTGKVSETLEINPNVIADLDSKGNLLYLEILDVGKNISKKNIKELVAAN